MKHDPTLYEPWAPASTCHIGSLIGPAIGAVGSLIGGSQAAGAAEDASDAQVQAAQVAAGVSREALGFQREMYNVGRADLAPYRASGAGALQTMNQMFIPGGHAMVQMQGQLGELRAQRARLMSGGTGAGGVQAPQGTGMNAANALLSSLNEGGGYGGDAATKFRADFLAETGHEFGQGGTDREVAAYQAYRDASPEVQAGYFGRGDYDTSSGGGDEARGDRSVAEGGSGYRDDIGFGPGRDDYGGGGGGRTGDGGSRSGGF